MVVVGAAGPRMGWESTILTSLRRAESFSSAKEHWQPPGWRGFRLVILPLEPDAQRLQKMLNILPGVPLPLTGETVFTVSRTQEI